MLRLALPKGSLEEQTLLLFKQADLEVKKTHREYNPTIDDPRIESVKILRPQEIPTFVAEGCFDIGISGHDWITETEVDVVEVADLPYSKAGSGNVRIVVAVHNDSGITVPEDIKPNSRVTTEFPNITRKYFERLGIPVSIHFSYGATEAKVPEIMDVLVDLTETGTTLHRNNLRILDTIMESSTKLIVNPRSWEDAGKRKSITEIRTLLLGVIKARGRVILEMNVPEDRLDAVVSVLPSLKQPTISQLYNSNYYSLTTVVPKKEVNILLPLLKEMGAEDILEMDISKIVP